MRTKTVRLLATGVACALLAGGCLQMIGLRPPAPPAFHGSVEAHGGRLGSWRLDAKKIVPPEGITALDVSDPELPGVVLRVISVDPPAPAGAAIVEQVIRRNSQVRIANARAAGGTAEVLLTPERCTRLDSILLMHRTRDGVVGSVRFDCDFPAEGHVAGDVEFAAGVYGATQPAVTGQIVQTLASSAATTFAPDHCAPDASGVLLWNAAHPRYVFDIEKAAVDGSITGQGSNASLRFTTTEPNGRSFDLTTKDCRVLHLAEEQTGFVRVGERQTTSYAGTVEMDCTAPTGARLVGTIRFDC